MNPTSQQILVCKNMKAYSIKKIINKKVTLSTIICNTPLKIRHSPIFVIRHNHSELFLVHKYLNLNETA